MGERPRFLIANSPRTVFNNGRQTPRQQSPGAPMARTGDSHLLLTRNHSDTARLGGQIELTGGSMLSNQPQSSCSLSPKLFATGSQDQNSAGGRKLENSWSLDHNHHHHHHSSASPSPDFVQQYLHQTESYVQARQKLYYHLASLFPKETVLQAMSEMPDETDPNKLCSIIVMRNQKSS